MEGKKNKKNRSNSGSSSVGVGIVAFLLGFLFAFIVLIGSIFGVGYVAVTTDINEVFRVFGLENVNDNPESDDDKYNYINADQAPNILALISEIMAMANDGLGEINLNRIDALAPVTDSILNFAYEYIDEVVVFDKEYFEDVPLTSVLDCLTNSMYYVRSSKVIELLNSKMGYAVDLSDIPIADYILNGVEAQYATVKVGGQTVKVSNGETEEDLKLPVLFDYYVSDTIDGKTKYFRTEQVGKDNSFPDNLNPDDYICETESKNSDDREQFKVYYVPCKITKDGISEAEYTSTDITVEDEEVKYTKDGITHNLIYSFRHVEYGTGTDFIAVKPEIVDGIETFVLDYDAIYAGKNSDPEATASYRYYNYSYFEPYARNYYSVPALRADKENDRMYGVSTINGINYFKDNSGNVIEYDPLTVSDIMLGAFDPLYKVPVYTLVGKDQAEVVRGIFGDTSLGAVLDQKVKFNDLINDIQLSTFLSDVRVDDSVMAFIVYNISNVKQDENGKYTATYGSGEDKKTVNLEVEYTSQGTTIIKSVTDESGKKVEGNKVSDLTTMTLDMTVGVFLDVEADDAIMIYLGYGITDVEKVDGKDYSHVGVYYDEDLNKDRKVYIYTDADGIVTKVEFADTGKELKGTTVDEIGSRIGNLTEVLTLPDVMDIEADSAIMAYIGYGVYDVVAESGDGYNYTGLYDVNNVPTKVYIATETVNNKPIITSVWYNENTIVKGTKVNEVSDRLDEITDKIAITEFVDVDPDDAIMAYIGYGVNHLAPAADNAVDDLGNSYNYTATYKDTDGVEHVCYITVDSENKITDIWYVEGNAKKAVPGTKIGGVPNRVESLKKTLTIGEIITVDENSTMILQALKDTTINGLDERINELTVSDVLSEEQINNNSVLPHLKDALVTELGDAIDDVLIQDIYLEDVYEDTIIDEVTDETFDPAYLYYERVGSEEEGYKYVLVNKNREDLTGTDYDNALGKLTQEEWNNRGDKKYYTYGKAKGMWKLVLYRMDNGVKTEKAYTLNNFNNMVDASSQTVYNSTLNELKEAGIITGITDEELAKTLKTVNADEPIDPVTGSVNYKYVTVVDGNVALTTEAEQAKKLGELTLQQLLKALTSFFA